MEAVLHEASSVSNNVCQVSAGTKEPKISECDALLNSANHNGNSHVGKVSQENGCINGASGINGLSSISRQINIRFENVTFTANEGTLFTGKSSKRILHEVNGRFPAGQLIAIMGPSGAGKSTLLNVLSGYSITGVGGNVYINGAPRNLKSFRKLSCYITQDDRLQPLLTVDENMHIAADLKLSSSVPGKEKKDIIDNILETLGLTKAKKTKAAGLSGGQKKRLSIALELINNPLVLFLDEPTTGLDSSSCSQCVKLLQVLARQGRTIVCTIHQPAASLFQLFNLVYVLSEGRCLYQGGTQKLINFFENVGCPCPQFHNPADYVIELACNEYGCDKVNRMVEQSENGLSLAYFEDTKLLDREDFFTDENRNKSINSDADDETGMQETSTYNQLKVLMRRGLIKSKRDQTMTYMRIGVNFFTALMLGGLYYNAGVDGSKVLDNYNLIFSILMHHMMSTMMLTILTFPQEMNILIKEHFNRWYSLKMYYTSVTLIDIPLSIFCCFIFSAVIYFLTAQPFEMTRFGMFFATSLLVVFVAQSFGLMIGAYFNVVNGTFLGPTLSVPMMMFAGFGVSVRDLPSYLYWGSYISYLRFALEGVVGSIYGMDRPMIQCPEDALYCHYKYPKKFLQEVGVTVDQFEIDMLALVLFWVLLRIGAFVVLKFKLHSVR